MKETKRKRLPNKFEAILPILVLLALMLSNYIWSWGIDPHVPVLIAAIVACAIGVLCGNKITDLINAACDSISQSMEALLILIFVGCLVGSFEWSGTIAAIVYYGLKLLTPTIFLPAVCLICMIVGVSLGSSYTVTATLGIAFITIGHTMGISPALVAGAVLSGGCTGDKFSPLSDSTNLSAAASQTALFDHIRAMIMTTFPSFLIGLLIFGGISVFGNVGTYDPTIVNELSTAIENNFETMSPVLFLPILVILLTAILKLPALPGVFLATFTGCVFAVIFQGAGFVDCITMVHYGYATETGNELADALLNRGGMDSMFWTINVALIAIGFGGIYSQIGAVESILGGLIRKVKTPFQMVAVTILTAMFCITTMCDQYLGLIVPASMYKEKFDDLGLARNLLSRSQEDGGTLWSPMVPWSSCGAYHSSMLGVSTFSYLPFCFVNIVNPIVSLATAAWGGNIIYADGTYTNFFGKLKKGNVPQAPAERHEIALKALKKDVLTADTDLYNLEERSINNMEFKGILKKRTTSRNVTIFIVGVLLMILEYKAQQYFYLPITAVILVAVFFKKEQIVSEKGVFIKRSIFGMTSDNCWTWDEITAVQPDYIKFRPNAQVTFEKGSMLRTFLVTPEDCDSIMKLAARMNPNMFVDDFTAEEQEAYEKEKAHRQEQMRAQRAKEKRSKKK